MTRFISNAELYCTLVGLAGVVYALLLASAVKSAPAGDEKMGEIAAGLSQKCRVLTLDEPTASLTDREVGRLFEQIRRLKNI